jgi:hypothetical protein
MAGSVRDVSGAINQIRDAARVITEPQELAAQFNQLDANSQRCW